MEIRLFTTVRLDATFRERLQEKVSRLSRFLFDEGTADLSIKKEGPEYVAELRIRSKRLSLFLKESSSDLTGSAELLLDKAKNLLRRQHERVIKRSHRTARAHEPA